MYLRFKRQKSTVFLSCEANEDLELVKQRLSDATNLPISDIQLRNSKNELLDEEKTLQEQNLHEDEVIYFVLKIADTADDWEEVDVQSTNQDTSSSNNQQTGNKK
eukprot:CAMPEP_0197022324 /NCGR_PEP_ID=MMETSP1384-20130603/3233_1 /TAXON_ID=29189 /ORGANISM="Ammonia sp." /LENGTH=104 /DNA_ID=CAMNT_0042450347 /DNA_START=26 /DNA_END=340 /DNA_ORIENTATION=+